MALSTSPTYQEMHLHERQAFLEEETSFDDWGTTLITIGTILLLGGLSITLFVGRDIRDGTHFFLRWEMIQTAVAVILIAVGSTMNRRAHTKDDA